MAVTRVSQNTLRRGLEKYNNALADYTPETGAFDSIATVTLGTAQATITFSSIPSTYKHLHIRGIVQASLVSGDGLGLIATVNNDTTTTNYRGHYLGGVTQAVSVGEVTGSPWAGLYCWAISGNVTFPALYTGICMTIFDYANTSRYKTSNAYVGYSLNAAGSQSGFTSSVWMNTAAINSLSFKIGNGNNFTVGSRLALYGMK